MSTTKVQSNINKKAQKSRIKILDGFRAIAIIAVLLFHYYSSELYMEEYYPYKGKVDYFRLGYLGVEFFFIISGFVISYTLMQTDNFFTFWKKRWIRLFPSMLIASILIYVIFLLVPENLIFSPSQHLLNFIPSLSFVNPSLFNILFDAISSNTRVDYLNGSFWSLWPEIQFYYFASTIYFIDRRNFIRNYVVGAAFVIMIYWLVGNVLSSNVFHLTLYESFIEKYKKWIQHGFNLPLYLIHFTLGVIFYQFYKNRQENISSAKWLKITFAVFVVYFIRSGIQVEVKIAFALMLVLFMCFIYIPELLSFFENKLLVSIGVASYIIYLIHENIGVMLIYLFGSKMGGNSYLFPVLIAALLIYLSILYTRNIDVKIAAHLKRVLFNR